MAVIASATGAAVFGLGAGTLAAGLAGGALLGAGAGALYSGITGDGNILNSALTGALIGGAAGGIGTAFAPAAAGKGIAAGTGISAAGSMTPAMAATKGTMAGAAAAPSGIAATQAAAGLGSAAAPAASTFGTLAGAGAPAGVAATQTAAGLGTLTPVAGMTGAQKLGLGLGATSLMSLMGSQNQSKLPVPGTQGMIRPYTYSSTQNPAGGAYPSPYAGPAQYDSGGNPILDTRERDYFTQSFTAGEPYKAANGGLMATYQAGGPVERMSQMNTALNPQGGLYPQGMIDKTQYATPTQRPTSMEVLQAGPQRMFADGGNVQGYNLGGYSDGGRLLKGPGDGVSDDIPAVIGDKQPARLADGEFVIPARIVSELGNGSTDAGAKRLYAMMDRIQAGRKKTVGKNNVAKDSKAKKHLLA
jgi:hypothetical protein